jgi:hypothetical protein
MSDIDSLRSQFSGPLSPMMRPKCCEEGAPYFVDPIEPSIPRDHLDQAMSMDGKIESISRQLSREDLLNGIVAQLMTRLGLTCIVLPSFDVECGPRVTVTPERVLPHTKDKHYFVQAKPGKAGS